MYEVFSTGESKLENVGPCHGICIKVAVEMLMASHKRSGFPVKEKLDGMLDDYECETGKEAKFIVMNRFIYERLIAETLSMSGSSRVAKDMALVNYRGVPIVVVGGCVMQVAGDPTSDFLRAGRRWKLSVIE